MSPKIPWIAPHLLPPATTPPDFTPKTPFGIKKDRLPFGGTGLF
jgi:hypothetical protein